MAGRRLREAAYSTLAPSLGSSIKVVVSSLSNGYASYVTTAEEYQQQRYEGASTLYGPHTLDAYIQAVVSLAEAMVQGKAQAASAPAPADFSGKVLSLVPPVVMDMVPLGHIFGEAVRQPSSTKPYRPGDTVEVVFWGANPRNNLRRGGTFLEVQLLQGHSQQWLTVYTDDDWSTKFTWGRPKSGGLLSSALDATSLVTIMWAVPADVLPGTYRIKYHGDAKSLLGKVTPFEGVSATFAVAA